MNPDTSHISQNDPEKSMQKQSTPSTQEEEGIDIDVSSFSDEQGEPLSDPVEKNGKPATMKPDTSSSNDDEVLELTEADMVPPLDLPQSAIVRGQKSPNKPATPSQEDMYKPPVPSEAIERMNKRKQEAIKQTNEATNERKKELEGIIETNKRPVRLFYASQEEKNAAIAQFAKWSKDNDSPESVREFGLYQKTVDAAPILSQEQAKNARDKNFVALKKGDDKLGILLSQDQKKYLERYWSSIAKDPKILDQRLSFLDKIARVPKSKRHKGTESLVEKAEKKINVDDRKEELKNIAEIGKRPVRLFYTNQEEKDASIEQLAKWSKNNDSEESVKEFGKQAKKINEAPLLTREQAKNAQDKFFAALKNNSNERSVLLSQDQRKYLKGYLASIIKNNKVLEQRLEFLDKITIAPLKERLAEIKSNKKYQEKEAERRFELAKQHKEEIAVPITEEMYTHLKNKIASSEELSEDQKIKERKALEKYMDVVEELKSPDKLLNLAKKKVELQKNETKKRILSETKRLQHEDSQKRINLQIAKTREKLKNEQDSTSQSIIKNKAKLKTIDESLNPPKKPSFLGKLRKRLPKWLGGN